MAFRKNRKTQATSNIAPGQSAYRPAYTPGSQGKVANNVFHNHQGATQYSRQNPAYATQSARKSKRGRNIALGVFAAVLVVAVGCGAAFAVWYNNVQSTLNHGDKTEEEILAINDELQPVTSYGEPFYMLLIGSDKREGESDADGARSDTNIVVRIDPSKNQATLVSIPRDTMIDIDGYGTNKFNAAYNYGGAASTIREATQLTGVGISHYAEVDFNSLVSLVDAVGGVDVMVDERIDDPDADGTTDNPDWEHIIIEAGMQHLDGDAALTFARSRQYTDGDFTRTSNQRKLIEALLDKVLALPATELPGVIQAAAQCVTTDMNVSDIISLARQFKDGGDLTMYSALLPSITGYVDGISYVFADEDAVEKMMKVVAEGGDPSGITGTTSKLAQKYNSSSSSDSSSGSTSGKVVTSGSGQYAGNDYDTGGGVGGVYSNYGSTSSTYDSSSGYGSSSTYDSYSAGTTSSGGYSESSYDSGYSNSGYTDSSSYGGTGTTGSSGTGSTATDTSQTYAATDASASGGTGGGSSAGTGTTGGY